MRGSAVVIGAGIAGLATARGLLGAGWSVRVLERSSGLPGTGTALGMWPEAMRALDRLGVGEHVRAASVEQRGLRVVVLDLRDVPAVDATGLVALESVIKRLNAKDVKVILAGVQPAALRVFAGAGWRNRHGRLRIFRSFDRGLALARDHANKFAAHGTGPIPRPPA